MKMFARLILLLLLLPGLATAAQVFGNLKDFNRSVGSGVELSIQCGRGSYRAVTDPYGSYNVFLKESGKCTLKVLYQRRWSKETSVFSSDDPTRYDFDLQRQGDELILKRR